MIVIKRFDSSIPEGGMLGYGEMDRSGKQYAFYWLDREKAQKVCDLLNELRDQPETQYKVCDF